jgi:AcrR family transcriptional regulator
MVIAFDAYDDPPATAGILIPFHRQKVQLNNSAPAARCGRDARAPSKPKRSQEIRNFSLAYAFEVTEIRFWSTVSSWKMAAIAPKKALRDSIAVKDSILDATDRLLARFGYRKMTVEDIAAEAGIGKGTIYLHFNSKEEVVLSHIDRIVDRLQVRLKEIARSNATAAERLRLMLLERVLFRFDSVQHYTQSLNDLLAALRPGLLARRAEYFEAEAQIFAEVLTAGREAGEFSFDESRVAAHALLQATNGLLPYSLSTTELGERAEVSQRVNEVAELVLRGVISRG